MTRIFLLACFSLVHLLLWAQTATDSIASSPDSARVEKRGTLIEPGIYLDYGKLALSFSNFESKFALGGEVRFFSRILLSAEYGEMQLTPDQAFENITYISEGSYLKAGAGYVGDFKQTYRLGLIARYGLSNFEDRGTIRLSDQTGLVDDYRETFERTGLTASWWELVLVSEKRLFLNKSNPESTLNRLFSVGFFFQVRFLIDYDSFELPDVNNIPGYGRSFDNSVPAFNLFFKINPAW